MNGAPYNPDYPMMTLSCHRWPAFLIISFVLNDGENECSPVMSVVQKRRARRGVDHHHHPLQGEGAPRGEDDGAAPSRSPPSLHQDASFTTDSRPSSYPVTVLDEECEAKLS